MAGSALAKPRDHFVRQAVAQIILAGIAAQIFKWCYENCLAAGGMSRERRRPEPANVREPRDGEGYEKSHRENVARSLPKASRSSRGDHGQRRRIRAVPEEPGAFTSWMRAGLLRRGRCCRATAIRERRRIRRARR